jgi:hypothetical protein
MALDAPTRELLVRFLADVVGRTNATDLVARLELDVSDLATRSDVAVLRSELNERVGRLETNVEVLRHELIGVFRRELLAAVTSQTRSMLAGVVSTAAMFAAAVVGVAQLG